MCFVSYSKDKRPIDRWKFEKYTQIVPEYRALLYILLFDAIHIACALEWNADLFVSSDEKQLLAAKKAGLKITQV